MGKRPASDRGEEVKDGLLEDGESGFADASEPSVYEEHYLPTLTRKRERDCSLKNAWPKTTVSPDYSPTHQSPIKAL
ncbi:hypothetical protein SKAU_G00211260 [Synaphobranchus kaupii]|uniref:Uncharacterized protein n=1 Tax=Synaphobranchus kaupii TaxID=118154 RepID=A0A9Q1F8S6_SYNKA|nr:hypothetical protein SKAU_G00211260 [Synaphobranchus kaupii]